MYGYVRPLVGELKVREFEQFKTCYCALCHSLGKNYGYSAKFILNYDFTFLTMLLWEAGDSINYEKKSCAACPIRKKTVCTGSDALKTSAGYSIILNYWKMRDAVADEGFFRSIPARFGMLALRRSYKKAAAAYPEFDKSVERLLGELSELEKQGERSIDKAADKFAQILSSVRYSGVNSRQRTLSLLLYHLGRWIYIIDAVNDIEEDVKSGNYNPIAAKYGLKDGKLDDKIKDELKITLSNSQNIVCSSFELLDCNHWASIIRNIIYSGMANVSAKVFNGTFENKREGLPR